MQLGKFLLKDFPIRYIIFEDYDFDNNRIIWMLAISKSRIIICKYVKDHESGHSNARFLFHKHSLDGAWTLVSQKAEPQK